LKPSTSGYILQGLSACFSGRLPPLFSLEREDEGSDAVAALILPYSSPDEARSAEEAARGGKTERP
jgi:hypothetical protein